MIEGLLCVAIAKSLVYDKIVTVSKDYGVSEGLMDYIVRNESNYNNCVQGDFHVPKPSIGLVQINMHYHPYITPQQATDPTFALEFLASKLKEGKCDLWTTCRAFKRKNPYANV